MCSLGISWTWRAILAPLTGSLCNFGPRSCCLPSVRWLQERRWLHATRPTLSFAHHVHQDLGAAASARHTPCLAIIAPQLNNTKTHYRELITREFKFKPPPVRTTYQWGEKGRVFLIKGMPYFPLPHFRESLFKRSYCVLFPAFALPMGKVEFTDENQSWHFSSAHMDLKQPRWVGRDLPGPVSEKEHHQPVGRSTPRAWCTSPGCWALPRPCRCRPSGTEVTHSGQIVLVEENSGKSQAPNTCFPIVMGYEIKYPNCANGVKGYLFLIKLLIT